MGSGITHQAVSLAYGMYSRKDVYSHALLLGSGVSRAANIPTVWDIAVDLLRRLHDDAIGGPKTSVNKMLSDGELTSWYLTEFGEEPVYGDLLARFSKTQEERSLFLEKYFEKPKDGGKGNKEPTEAHKAIARLARLGYIKVIVTTNLDRLIEDALRAEGIVPNVITDDNSIDTSTPLVHPGYTVVKVNGDYKGLLAKNTLDELETLSPKMEDLVRRIFDEFGLIICGWSGEWDKGIVKALTDSAGQRFRFSTYWLHRDRPLSAAAEEIVEQRKAEKIRITNADDFFTGLEGRVNSFIAEYGPLGGAATPELAAETAREELKALLPCAGEIIKIHDIVAGEAAAMAAIQAAAAKTLITETAGRASDTSEVLDRIRGMDAASVKFAAMLATGVYWGPPPLNMVWEKALEIVAAVSRGVPSLGLYIPVKALYTLLISALAGGKYALAYNALNRCFSRGADGARIPLRETLHSLGVMTRSDLNTAMDTLSETPLSEWLFKALWPVCEDVLRVESNYEMLFDKAEYLISLNYRYHMDNVDDAQSAGKGKPCPLGRFALKKRRVYEETDRLLDGDMQGLLDAGFFGGVLEKYRAAADGVTDLFK